VTAKIQSIAILAAAVAIAASAASPKTVMDGVYTTAQAGRGKTAYISTARDVTKKTSVEARMMPRALRR